MAKIGLWTSGSQLDFRPIHRMASTDRVREAAIARNRRFNHRITNARQDTERGTKVQCRLEWSPGTFARLVECTSLHAFAVRHARTVAICRGRSIHTSATKGAS